MILEDDHEHEDEDDFPISELRFQAGNSEGRLSQERLAQIMIYHGYEFRNFRRIFFMDLVARLSAVFFSFVALAGLTFPDARAQEPGGPHPAPASSQTTVVQDSVAQYLMNPDGYVDGLLLSNNTIIRFPPHLGQVLTQTVSLKDVVRVEGFFESPGILHASSIIDLQSRRLVVDTPPSSRYPRPPRPGGVIRQPLSASGTIRVLTHGKRGELNGLVLSDGTVIHFPPSVGMQFAALLREGNALAATGYGTSNQYGRSFEATAIGPSMNQLETVTLDSGLKPTPGTGP